MKPEEFEEDEAAYEESRLAYQTERECDLVDGRTASSCIPMYDDNLETYQEIISRNFFEKMKDIPEEVLAEKGHDLAVFVSHETLQKFVKDSSMWSSLQKEIKVSEDFSIVKDFTGLPLAQNESLIIFLESPSLLPEHPYANHANAFETVCVPVLIRNDLPLGRIVIDKEKP